MKYSAVASVLFAVAAVAQPHGHLHHRHHEQHKREMVTEIEWVTETQYVTKLVDSTTTVWVTPGQEAKPTTTSTTTTEQAKFIESKASTTTSTSTSTTTSTSVYVAPEPTTTSTTSVYVAPEPTTTSTSVYVAPEPTTTEVYVAPTTTTQVYVAPTTTEEAPAASTTAASTGGSSGGSATVNSGEMTYYTLGQGSCGTGYNNAGEDLTANVVALSHLYLNDGANPNLNPLCGQTITIKASNGKTTTAKISDKCPSCAYGSIDVSEKIFLELMGSTTAGRVEVSWWLN